ncbi:MAG: protein kinase [Pseudomonadota bacterium]
MGDRNLERRALDLLERALDQPSEARAEWVASQAGDDDQLHKRVLSLLAHDSLAEAGLQTGGARLAPDDPPPPQRIGAYRIDGVIGRGGMGAVYKGVRDAGDFDHTAAIKVIRPGLLRDELVERFQRERQILADLNHPGIARLLDGGTLEDGAPYFVMEFVDGQPLTEWADAQGLSLRGRVELMVSVCEAVRFAHQNLIIHRDLTPSNVLVTREGQAKLIDFGIARPDQGPGLDAQDASSLPSLSFTPGYAAPERSKGAAVSTLSDVYSLGQLLRTLMSETTGNRDLSAIIQKATASLPADRYPSADALRDDLDAWLTHKPVSARRGGLPYQFGKLLKRRPFALTSGVMVLMGLMGGLITTNMLYVQADAARKEADRRFEDVRALASTMMFDMYDALERVPRSSQAQLLLAEASQTYLDDLAAADQAPVDVRLETAQGLARLAEIQGSPSRGARLDPTSAKANLERAVEMLEELLDEAPDNDEARLILASVFVQRSQIASYIDQHIDAAEAFAKRAIEVANGDGPQSNSNLQNAAFSARAELAFAAQVNTKDQAPSMELYSSLITDAKAAIEERPEDRKLNLLLTSAETNLGRSFVFAMRGAEALEHLDSALSRVSVLVDAEPDNPVYIRARSRTLGFRGFANMNSGRGLEAISDYENALADLETLIALDPNNENWPKSFETTQAEMMGAYAVAGQFEESERLGRLGLERTRGRLKDRPGSAELLRNEMIHLFDLTLLYQMWGKSDKRCQAFTEMKPVIESLEEADAFLEVDRQRADVMSEALEVCS